MPATPVLPALLACALATGCVPERQEGPLERVEKAAYKTVNRKHTGEDGIYVQATLRTFAYEIAEAYARAERQDLDQTQLESRLREVIYSVSNGNYPVEDGTDINSLYIQYLIYVSPSFDVSNPLQKRVFDNWSVEYVRRVLDRVYDRKVPILRDHYDERWGLSLYSRLVFDIYLDSAESDLRPRIDDIGARTFLVDEQGSRYAPSGLAGPYPYEFYRPKEAILDGQVVYRVQFPNRRADRKTPIVTPGSIFLALEIDGLGDEPVRRLQWDLPLAYPEMPMRRLPSPAEMAARRAEEKAAREAAE